MEASDLGFERVTPDEQFASEEPRASDPAREGLPSSYRMRADTHYVDTLVSRRERFEPPTRPAPTPTPVAARHDTPAADETDAPLPHARRRSDRLLAQVGDEIAAIASAAALIDVDATPLVRQAGQELIRAQAWRAAWLLKASTLLDGRHLLTPRPTRLVSLVERLREGLMPECRLAGVALHVHAPDVTVMTDATLLSTAVTGAVIATTALVAGTTGATVSVLFDVVGGGLLGVDVTQDLMPPQAPLIAGFFDAGLADRPGGWTALMGAVTVREAARQSGGTATFGAAGGGSRVRIGLAE